MQGFEDPKVSSDVECLAYLCYFVARMVLKLDVRG